MSIKSAFNEPYRTDIEMKADTKTNSRKQKMKERTRRNLFADQMFKIIVDMIENGGKESFTKEEIIRAYAGVAKVDTGQWHILNKACTTALNIARKYFWNGEEGSTIDKRMLNYVRPEDRYYLVDISDMNRSNLIVSGYDEKIKGLRNKTVEILTSAYDDVLESTPAERRAFVEKLQQSLNDGRKLGLTPKEVLDKPQMKIETSG